jgi:hypothetical protein
MTRRIKAGRHKGLPLRVKMCSGFQIKSGMTWERAERHKKEMGMKKRIWQRYYIRSNAIRRVLATIP